MNILERVATVGGIVASAVALWSLTVTVLIDQRDRSAEEVRQRQESLVYLIVKESGISGKTFEEIGPAFRDGANARSEFQLPNEAITDAALARVLLRLTASSAIVLTRSETYVAVRLAPGGEMLATQEDMGQVFESVTALVQTENCRYTEDQAYLKLKDSHPRLQPHQFHFLLSNMAKGTPMAPPAITLDASGRICKR